MADAPGRVEIFYDYDGRGFSECFWTTQVATKPSDLQPIIDNYLASRMVLAVQECRASYIRWSSNPANRQAVINDLTGQNIVGTLKLAGCAPDDVLFCKFSGGTPPNLVTGWFHLHAFPAKNIKDKLLVLDPTYKPALDSFFNLMPKFTPNFLIRSRVASIPANRVPITQGLPNQPRGAHIKGNAAATVAVGNVVKIGNAGTKQYGYSGYKKVVALDGTDPASFYVGGVSPIGAIANGAYYEKVTYNAVQINAVQLLRLSERKTGRPTELPAGRKPNVLPLRQ